MKTLLGNHGKLSQKQMTRLGGLIALVCGRTPYEQIIQDLNENGFLAPSMSGFQLSEDGRNELTRLTAMAGLRPEQFTDRSS
jgi:hypothetical protein